MAVTTASPSASSSETSRGRTAPDPGESRYEVQPVLPFTAPTRRVVVQFHDDCGATDLPRWVKSAKHVTDGHLAALAARHNARLATLDGGIPGGLVIPLT